MPYCDTNSTERGLYGRNKEQLSTVHSPSLCTICYKIVLFLIIALKLTKDYGYGACALLF